MKAKCIFPMCVCAVALTLSGCYSNRVAWVEGPEPKVRPELSSKVRFSGTAAQILNAGSCRGNENALDVAVSYTVDSSRDGVGFIGSVNNFCSWLTLWIWPHVCADDYECTVAVSGYGKTAERKFTMGKRAWTSFLLPLAAIPCPGWGDWRSGPRFGGDWFASDEYLAWREKMIAGYASELMTDSFVKELEADKPVCMVLLRNALGESKREQGGDRRPMLAVVVHGDGIPSDFAAIVKQRFERALESSGLYRLVAQMPQAEQISTNGSVGVVNVHVSMDAEKKDGSLGLVSSCSVRFKVRVQPRQGAPMSFENEYYGDFGRDRFIRESERVADAAGRAAKRFCGDYFLQYDFSIVSCDENGEVVVEMPRGLAKEGETVDLYSRELVGAAQDGKALFAESKVAEIVIDKTMGDVMKGRLGKVFDTAKPWRNVSVRKRKAAGELGPFFKFFERLGQ